MMTFFTLLPSATGDGGALPRFGWWFVKQDSLGWVQGYPLNGVAPNVFTLESVLMVKFTVGAIIANVR